MTNPLCNPRSLFSGIKLTNCWGCTILIAMLLAAGCKDTLENAGAIPVSQAPASVTIADSRAGHVKFAPRAMEKLNRGVVVIPVDSGNVVSWRLLGTDDPGVAFNVYRNGKKLNADPVTDTTFYRDRLGDRDDSYRVGVVENGREGAASSTVKPWDTPYRSIPLSRPENAEVEGEPYAYVANDASAADLDGDGQYEIILQWDPTNARDNSHRGVTGNVLLDAYSLQGKLLWRINLGPNIRAGAHYTQFIAYDFDSDGRAELAMKTADGTIDGRGDSIGIVDAIHRNDDGYVLHGREYLTMFDGLTGAALDTIDYVPARGRVSDWGDNRGNRVDRFLAGLAYLDGKSPSLLMARGYYTRAVVAAFDWVDGGFSRRWVFDSDNGGEDRLVAGQGAHSLAVGDVDADGRDEIVYGAATIDDDGHLLYSTGLCHGDALHLGDLDPNRRGLEVYMVHESPDCYANAEQGYDHGFEMHDAENGDILWSRSGEGSDVGRGVSADIDPRYDGSESWSTRGGLVAADGTDIGAAKPASINFAVYWDGDPLRELLDGTTISKWNYDLGIEEPLLQAGIYGAVSNNGTKATPALSADLFGDWREEVVWANEASDSLLIFSTTLATDIRLPSLMHDPQYRMAIAWQNVGYNQPPHTSYFLGGNMVPVTGGD